MWIGFFLLQRETYKIRINVQVFFEVAIISFSRGFYPITVLLIWAERLQPESRALNVSSTGFTFIATLTVIKVYFWYSACNLEDTMACKMHVYAQCQIKDFLACRFHKILTPIYYHEITCASFSREEFNDKNTYA